MPAHRPWTVLRHDPIEKHEDNLWTVAGDLPGIPFIRRMSIVKLSNGDLLFFNAVPLSDAALEEVRGWGRPAALIVPNENHLIDAHAFREKLGISVYGPEQSRARIAARVDLAGRLEDAPCDGCVAVHVLPGVKLGEPVISVRSDARVSLLFGDAIQNTPKESIGLIYRMAGFGGGPKVVPVFRAMFVKDKKSFAARLGELAETSGLTRLVPSHGSIVASEAANALRDALPRV